MPRRINDLIPDLPAVDAAGAIDEARRRQRRRTILQTTLAAGVAGIVAVSASVWWPRHPDAVPTSSSTAGSTPGAVVCPSPVPKNGEQVLASYMATLRWGGKVYYEVPDQTPEPGEQIGKVTCDIVAIQDKAKALWHGPWPDGSSTAAGAGTPIHAVAGKRTSCYLTMKLRDGSWALFQAKGC